MTSRHVAIVGAGPAGLFAAERIASAGHRVTVFDRMPSPARKLLMAGRGGLNLTHSEPLPVFLDRYRDARPWLEAAVATFGPSALQAWAASLGQPCFIGSSGRVFPEAMKASPLVRAWLKRLDGLGVALRMRYRLLELPGSGHLRLDTPEGERFVGADAVLLALGGGSWARLGSDGAWTRWSGLSPASLAPLAAANCGFRMQSTTGFPARYAGTPIKPVAVAFENERVRGELVVTRFGSSAGETGVGDGECGLEGGAIYALSGPIRRAIERDGRAVIRLDLRPGMSEAALCERLARLRPRESLSNALRKALRLPPVAVALLREAGVPDRAPAALAALLKAVPVVLVAPGPLDRAISTAGGLRREALDPGFMLRDRPGVFAAGEMLDWEAPTGGYLLQGCFATGLAAADGLLDWLRAGLNPPR
ncbi:TIGR03862 family flavoprotein [Rhizosaccharibacter radicis]|uniref:TIGR03862 family flavoprotein n=1 Tax=Rhizosaccharibacter radicis TaxID=2782605 RepID=A0ABT1VVX8_9PROT|nr:TIGR03862 family flavoprotein [Acetobacteraceae bacterium KSS12]